MTTHAELAEFILAFERGEKVERYNRICCEWDTTDGKNWNIEFEYRIVKTPKKRVAECWNGEGFLHWITDGKDKSGFDWKRITALDMTFEEDE